MVIIKIKELIGSDMAVSSADGRRVYAQIIQALEQGKSVQLDFEGIKFTISAFLNSAVGVLYSKKSVPEIQEKLSVVNMNEDDLFILRFVTSQAKIRFAKFPENDNSDKDILSDGD